MTSEPERSVEVERKYDVELDTPLPDWRGLPGVVSIDDPEPRELDARYLDTADGSLGRARVALRRRSGGPDEGWHVKRASAEGKLEARWPLGAADELDVPDGIVAELEGVAAPPFLPLARVRNARTAYLLRDGAGAVVAEFVDDRVHATDERTGRESTWREWELELGPAGPVDAAETARLFVVADDLVTRAGGHVSESGSKLGRALGV